MKKQDYLDQTHVSNFIKFVLSKEATNEFRHTYVSLNPRLLWDFHSIYNAFEKYNWKGKDFKSTTELLQKLQHGLREAVAIGQNAHSYCEEILKWGGVLNKGNKNNINSVESFTSLENRLKDAQSRLNPNSYDLTDPTNDILISSGFSKIYSLLIDDFVIYDSRVAAALCLLVRKYSEECNLPSVPSELQFARTPARQANGHLGEIRNASQGCYTFPRIYNNNNPQRYIENNMKATWLINSIAKHENSVFRDYPSPQRCLESALFMIGYKVNQ